MIRVLMIGKSEATMQRMAIAMGPDFAVTISENTPRVLQTHKGTDFDAVILGRALPEEARAVLRNKLQKENQALVIVKSLGPFGELVAMQARAALSGQNPQPAVRNLQYTQGALTFELAGAADVLVTLYREDLFFRLQQHVLKAQRLPAGACVIPFRKKRFGHSHVVVQTGQETHLISL